MLDFQLKPIIKMKKIFFNLPIVLMVYIFIIACDSKPKVIEGKPIRSEEPALSLNMPADRPTMQNDISDGHLVVINEVLDTEKYSYLNVSEDGDKYWIAIPRKEVEIGSSYFYRGGLLKKNFESKEYNRVFETIYLVPDIIPHPSNVVGSESNDNTQKEEISSEPVSVEPVKGSIKLSELFADPDKYNGKLIQVTGKCVKVNPMIMGRNWVHIQDGSSQDLDLTITTTENVTVDAIVTFKGAIALNKDFGAGYKYDLIMEMATLQ